MMPCISLQTTHASPRNTTPSDPWLTLPQAYGPLAYVVDAPGLTEGTRSYRRL